MEENSSFFGALLERLENYVKTTIDLYKLKAVDKLSKAASGIVTGLLLTVLAFFFLMILNFAVAFWLGDLLGKVHYGFFTLAGFYVLLIVIIIVFKKQLIKTPITNSIISKFLK